MCLLAFPVEQLVPLGEVILVCRAWLSRKRDLHHLLLEGCQHFSIDGQIFNQVDDLTNRLLAELQFRHQIQELLDEYFVAAEDSSWVL